ncbi:Bug family tripartite tricarboxylate transporter substrate binding protein [Salirhabdus salicampi]|uniref:Bug family tripartite tricarboxylate transporter substrate binding protein n=1 Tax=Salirhabdus salicampi TaxID=476102 RepID=UPI0020C45EB8|nr:hypothetical protein [Salirhabdus salicampi]MCP8616315.1 hypothetical protein [Salirhabdus salicampi]
MKFKLMNLLLLIIPMVLIVGCSQSSSGDGEKDSATFYEGETMEVIVPFGAGGGTDTFARFIQPYLQKHIPSEPSVQVVNIPGGGSINGANEFVKVRKHDGYTALVTSGSTALPYLLGQKAVEYDLKKMTPILAIPQGGAVYTSPTTGIETPKDLANPKEPLLYAGISATGNDLVTLLSFELLEVDVQSVLGYEGRGPSRVAFEQGESNIDYQTVSAFKESVTPLIDSGDAIPLYSFGMLDANGDVIRDPAFPDLPSVKEVYKDIHGKDPSGLIWDAYKAALGAGFGVQKILWLHDDAPQAAVDALLESAESIKQDDDFIEKSESALGGYELIIGDQLDGAVQTITSASDEVLNWIHEYLLEEHGVSID